MTMTALFAPEQTVLATSLESPSPTETGTSGTPSPSNTLAPTQAFPSPTPQPTATQQPTSTSQQPTSTPIPTATPEPTAVPPTPTPSPTESYEGPGQRPGVSITASYFNSPPVINGDLWDWSGASHPVNNAAYGADKISSPADLSGTVMVGWDASYLYLGGWVVDENYVQNATGKNLFKGDSLEILLDVEVSNDFYLDKLSSDDYQVGISPGKSAPGNSPEAYLWYPRNVAGPRSQVQIKAMDTGEGYQFEIALPWSMFGVTPQAGDHYGFGFSISDNDKDGSTIQQSMISNLTSRVFTHPMTWGDLTLGP